MCPVEKSPASLKDLGYAVPMKKTQRSLSIQFPLLVSNFIKIIVD